MINLDLFTSLRRTKQEDFEISIEDLKECPDKGLTTHIEYEIDKVANQIITVF